MIVTTSRLVSLADGTVQPIAGSLPEASTRTDGGCMHLGPETGELRECATCGGNVRQKVHGCAIHGTTTVLNCRSCGDYKVP